MIKLSQGNLDANVSSNLPVSICGVANFTEKFLDDKIERTQLQLHSSQHRHTSPHQLRILHQRCFQVFWKRPGNKGLPPHIRLVTDYMCFIQYLPDVCV